MAIINYYIDPESGSDSNNGNSWATAFKTFSKILTLQVTPTAEEMFFHLRSGIYYSADAQIVPTAEASISLIGYGAVSIRGTSSMSEWTIVCHPYYEYYNPYGENPKAYPYCNFININFSGMSIKTSNVSMTTNNLRVNFVNCTFFDAGVIRIFTNNNSSTTMDNGWFQFINCTAKTGLEFPVSGGTIAKNSSNLMWPTDVDTAVLPSGACYEGYSSITTFKCLATGIPLSPPGIVITPPGSGSDGAYPLTPVSTQIDSVGASFVACTLAKNQRVTFTNAPVGTANTIYRTNPPALRAPFLTDGWISDTSMSGGTLDISDSYGAGIHHTSVADAAALSPVYDYGKIITIKSIGLSLFEPATNLPGENEVVDSTPLDTTRTVQYRVSDTSFVQSDVLPAWGDQERDSVTALVGRYFQLRLVFTSGGA